MESQTGHRINDGEFNVQNNQVDHVGDNELYIDEELLQDIENITENLNDNSNDNF